MTNQAYSPECDDDEAVDLDCLFDELVLSDNDSERDFLRTQWIERILNQLVSLRIDHELTQRQLGERIGKPQSSIARIESASDMKLSVLWDYLSGIGLSPTTPLQVTALTDEIDALRRYSVGGRAGLPKVPKYEFHRSALAKAHASMELQGFEEDDPAARATENDDAHPNPEMDKAVVTA